MAQNNGENNERRRNNDSWLDWGAAIMRGAAALTAAAGAAYLAHKVVNRHTSTAPDSEPDSSTSTTSATEPTTCRRNATMDNLCQALTNLNSSAGTIDRSAVPRHPVITNLSSLLEDIYVRYVQLKNEDFQLYYNVFTDLFSQVQSKMKMVDPYYDRYSSRKQIAGSHFDNLRIVRPDEFDVDIVIGLPLNFDIDPMNPGASDITIETISPGFVQLKTGTQFQRLPIRDGKEWQINKTVFDWCDDKGYLLQQKFIDWFKSVIMRATNTFDRSTGHPQICVNGIPYTIKFSESGPAVTMFILNSSNNFKLDVDFVPALKFPERRWPVSGAYRRVPAGCNREDFMIVPKLNKSTTNAHLRARSWRIAMQDQEKRMLHDTNNLRKTVRLLKKLRDAQNMSKIASYYIKTLFFWEIDNRKNQTFWSRNSPEFLFKLMVQKLYEATAKGNIPYFWNHQNNLLEGVPNQILKEYANKLEKLMKVLNNPSGYKEVAKYLLTPAEFQQYNRDFLHI